MKKVGILSMQRIANYGSFLQAYGLKCILEELGCQVEFVDYHPGETLIPADGGTGIKRKISKVYNVLKNRAPLSEKLKFIRYKKNYSSRYLPLLGVKEQMNYSPELDMLIIGSDEVFNCVQNNTNVGFCPELFGEGNCAARLISYAASFGNTTSKKLSKYHVKEQVADWLKNFDALSARDSNSEKIVEDLTGTKPLYHLDPVLMYDFLGECKQIPSAVPENKYMILYGYSGRFTREECKQIRSYAEQRNLNIFCIGGIQDCCDRFVDCNPFEVIAYFQNAECVITDTFHGTILSIITHKPFASVVRNAGYGNVEKLEDLLIRLELEGHMVTNMSNFADKMAQTVDYLYVDQIIADERARCRIYLQEQIDMI